MVGFELNRWPKPAPISLEGPPPGMKHTPRVLEKARSLYDRPSFVNVNDGGVVYQTENIGTAIVTSNLWTCTATVVQFASPNQRGSALSHFDLTIPDFSTRGLDEEFIEQLNLLAEQQVEARAIVISPGKPDTLSPTGYGTEEKSDSRHVTTKLSEIFGDGLPITHVGYSREHDRGPMGGTVLVGYSRVPKRAPNAMLLRTAPRFLIGGVDVSGKL